MKACRKGIWELRGDLTAALRSWGWAEGGRRKQLLAAEEGLNQARQGGTGQPWGPAGAHLLAPSRSLGKHLLGWEQRFHGHIRTLETFWPLMGCGEGANQCEWVVTQIRRVTVRMRESTVVSKKSQPSLKYSGNKAWTFSRENHTVGCFLQAREAIIFWSIFPST